MNKIIKICCISIILISLVSVNYFFYLKKEHKENDFPNIISTSVSYIDNKLIITYDIDEKELVHNKIYCNYDVDNDKYSTFKNEWVETKDNKCIINIDTKGKYYVYLKKGNHTKFPFYNLYSVIFPHPIFRPKVVAFSFLIASCIITSLFFISNTF